MGYSLDFRQQVFTVKKRDALTIEETAQRFGIGTTTISRWKRRIEPKTTRDKGATKIDEDKLKKDVEENPDKYLWERASEQKVSTSAVYYALQRLGLSYKKNASSSKRRRRKKV